MIFEFIEHLGNIMPASIPQLTCKDCQSHDCETWFLPNTYPKNKTLLFMCRTCGHREEKEVK